MARIFRFLVLLVGCSSWLSTAMAAPSGEQELLEYSQTHDMVAYDDIPMLRVFDSGRVRVHLPAWKKNRGDYEYFLSDAEFKALKERLESRSVADFDKSAVERDLHAAEAAARARTGRIFVISDNTYTHMTVNPDINGLEKNITWTNLQNDARRHPDLKELVELADTVRLLQQLLHHPKMKKLD